MNFKEQFALFEELKSRIVRSLQSDVRVRAVWLGGSLGRGEGDGLSDIDLVVVAREGRVGDLIGDSAAVLSLIGPVALVHEAPQNAPADGAQLNVLYDTYPLPINIDWNIWPKVDQRPSDVSVMLEVGEEFSSSSDSFQTMLSKMPPRVVTPKTKREWDHFRVFMVPIVVKNAARGWFDSVHRVLEYMQRPGLRVATLKDAIKVAHDVLAESGRHEAPESIACIRRYLNVVADLAES